jgi:hypothetical protein
MNATARFGHGTLYIGDIDNSSEDPVALARYSMSFIKTATVLVHEMSHLVYGGHTAECTSGETKCDETRDGAYGAGAWWTYLWLLENHGLLHWTECFEAEWAISDLSCPRIMADDAWPVCADDEVYGRAAKQPS